MANYPHPQSGPQEPPFIKSSHMRNQEYTRSTSGLHQQNFSQPIYPGQGAYNQNVASPGITRPPSQIDIPRELYPQSYYQVHQQVPTSRPNYNAPMNRHAARNVNAYVSNSPNHSGHLHSVELPQQPPELPPKPHSGQQQLPPPPLQQQQQPQQPQHFHQHYQQQLQVNQQQMYQQQQPIYPPPARQQINPYPYQPPPVPDRPGQVKVQQVYDKQKTSGNIGQVDLTESNQLDELNNPKIVAAKLKKIAEVLSAVPEKYEAAIQGKAKKMQESVTRAYQDLNLLKEELQKAKTALNYTETDSHALKGELQVLKQENQQLRQQTVNEPIDFSNEETKFLIKDLRKQILNLQLEVPDPNLCESLRLMIQLMDEDRKIVEKKYTEVTNELHDRDNEISRLMAENQVSGNFIQGGQVGLEKQFNATLADLRQQNSTLSQQLEYASQKLEMNLRRDATEKEPGPSRVELMGMVENANNLNDKLQAKVREKEEDIVRVKKLLESSREVMSSSSSMQNESVNNDEKIFLQIEIKNLERDLGIARENEKKSELTIQEKDQQLRQLTPDNPANKDKSKVDLEKLKPLQEKIMIYTNWLNERDTYIKKLQDIISQQKNDLADYQVNSDDLQRELTQTSRTKDDLLRSDQLYRTKVQQLEALRASSSSASITEESYAGTMRKMRDEMTLIQVENEKLHQQSEKECSNVLQLEKTLKDLERKYSQLLNQQRGVDYREAVPRYSHTSNAAGAGSGHQGRDRGVPHP